MEFKTGEIVKILSPDGAIIFKVLPYGRIEIIRLLTVAETGRPTLNGQKITILKLRTHTMVGS